MRSGVRIGGFSSRGISIAEIFAEVFAEIFGGFFWWIISYHPPVFYLEAG
jgi:hypothetical protein